MSNTTATSTHQNEAPPSLLKQPKAVWAVAFASVIAFMGIGLVDPILKPIGEQLDATPSQVSLLFTSYMLVTGVAMLITGVVSSRIGAKKTLLAGLAIIIVFASLAGASSTIGQIVGFRAGWGLGNALFIATALAAIVGAASGGVARAIILYEAALGIGIAVGPLVGGVLGDISWRAPFFGVAALMAVAFILIVVMLPSAPKPEHHTSIAAPFQALRHRGLLTVAITALLYNYGFFTLLAYTPFPLDMGAYPIGFIFFGWGLMLAISSGFPRPSPATTLRHPADDDAGTDPVRTRPGHDGALHREQDRLDRRCRPRRFVPRREQHTHHRNRHDLSSRGAVDPPRLLTASFDSSAAPLLRG